MTDKELRRLKRSELLQLLLEQTEENERLSAALDEANARLRERDIAVSEAGTLAEAALSINGILSAADESARQYLENIQKTSANCDALVAEAKKEAEAILQQAQAQREALLRDARQQADARHEPKSPILPKRERAKAASSEDLRQSLDAAFEQMKRRNRL